MKRIGALVALMAAAWSVADAQGLSQPASLSVFDNEGVLTDRFQYRYDANGNQIEEIDFSGDDSVGNMKRSYTYTPDGRMLTATAKRMVDGRWTDYSRNMLSYNSDGNLEGECNYLWMDGAWKPSVKTVIENLESGVTRKTYGWNGTEWNLTVTDIVGNEDVVSACSYDDNGNVTKRISYDISDSGVRENNYMTDYSYDSYGRLSCSESYFWNDGQWVLDSTERYEYADAATCLRDIAGADDRPTTRKVLSNGRVSIMTEASVFQINGVKE